MMKYVLAAALIAAAVGLAGCASGDKVKAGTGWVPPEEMREDQSVIERKEIPPYKEETLPVEPVPEEVMPPVKVVMPDRIPDRPRDVIGKLDVHIRRKWDYIVIHHSGASSGNAQIFDEYHRSRGWEGVGYDFVIGNGHGQRDGAVEVTFRWEQQKVGAHAGVREYNEHGIGICLVGNFETSVPTQKQIESLVSLITYLQERCNIASVMVIGHGQVKNTNCPGRNFPYFEVLALLTR